MEQNSPVFNLDDSAMADTRRNDDASGDEEEKEESVECVEVIRDPCYPPDGFVPPSQRSPVPPLAGILDRKLEEIDPRQQEKQFRRFFGTEYKQDAILRFSRVFAANAKPSNNNQIWWTSRTFKKHGKVAVAGQNDRPGSSNNDDHDDWALKLGPPPRAEDCVEDENDLLCRDSSSADANRGVDKKPTGSDDEEDEAPWRYGPAQIWYDRLGLGKNPTNFNYGFELGKKATTTTESGSRRDTRELLPVELEKWEENIILDDEEAREKAAAEFAQMKYPKCGWIPTQQTRNYQSFVNAWHNGSFQAMFSSKATVASTSQEQQPSVNTETIDPTLGLIDASHSMFPPDNYDLEDYRWEDDVIIDPKQVSRMPKPTILTLEFEDDPRAFGVPEDRAEDGHSAANDHGTKQAKSNQFARKSNLILNQVHNRQQQEAEEQLETNKAQSEDKDPFNLSNDDYYFPQNIARNLRSTSVALQHSVPAQNLHRLFFPTDIDRHNPAKLRNFHHAPIKKKNFRPFIGRWAAAYSLARHIRLSGERRDKERVLETESDVLQMREMQDLGGRDGTILLLEYVEKNPPLLSQTGMASKLRNYYKRVDEAGKDEPEFGEATYIHSSSPFLGTLANDQCLQAIENNMYRASLFRHTPKRTDFLLIRTKFGLFIRQIPTLFLVGQEHPLMQVPSPSSKQAAAFSRDFLMAYIYRLFWESDDSPRRVKFQEIRRAFSHLTENAIKKRLKGCADMRKIGAGAEQVYWVLRDDFRLPSKEEVHSMITPEMCCAYWSMLSAEQRLRDAGYGDKYIFAVENEDSADEESTEKESEVKCAPWNTTRAYLAVSKGRCLLDQTGVADPTGCGLGFSFVRVALRPPKEKETFQIPKRLVTGTNADLRKLPLKEAREMCRGWGLSEEEMNSLSRWELVDVIRTLSTQAAKAGSDFSGVGRFARGNLRLDVSDAQEKQKAFCQQRFELQNRVLESAEESASENEDLDNMDANEHCASSRLYLGLQSTVSTLDEGMKNTIAFQLDQLRQLDATRSVGGGTSGSEQFVSRAAREAAMKSGEAKTSQAQMGSDTTKRKLKIHRLTKNAAGTESVVEEVVTHPQLIEAYLRIRAMKDEAFIKVYSHDDEYFKEEKRKEKRRQMEDKVRVKKKSEEKPQKEKVPKEVKESPSKPRKEPKQPRPPKPPPPVKESLLKMKCSSCGAFGHMKTNRHCPLYGKEVVPRVKTVGEICERHDEPVPEMAEMVAIEGMRLKISRKHVEKLKKNALRLHIPRHLIGKRAKQAKAKLMSEQLKNEGRKAVGDVHQPSTSSGASKTGEEGKSAMPSSKLKGGLTLSISIPTIPVTITSAMQPPPPQVSAGSAGLLTPGGSSTASGMVARRRGTLEEADYLIGPQKSVQRRRADPRISMASALHDIFNEFKVVENVDLLALPNIKKVPDYYDIIHSPIDLQVVRNNISANKYELRRQFLEDLKQIYVNSCTYNGSGHLISKASKEVLDLATKKLTEREKKLISLEKAINPLLDDDDMVGFSHILLTVVQACKNLPKSGPFHDKVDSKKHPFYYQRIERPIDLGTIERNIKKHHYTTVATFRRDIEQMYDNSLSYNGPGGFYTTKAREIMDLADRLLHENEQSLAELEANIQRTMQVGDEGMSMASSDVGGLLELDPDPISAALFSAGGAEEGDIEERYKRVGDEQGGGTSAEITGENPLLPDTLNLAGDLLISPVPLGETIAEERGTETAQEVGVLHEDLALSDEEEDSERGDKEREDAGSDKQYSPLEHSQMHATGQLNSDLALSNSEEDEEEQIEMAKRPRLDQEDFDASL